MIPPIKPEPVLTYQHTADKTRRQTRTVSNGEGDKARQHWHHQRKRGAAANLHQRGRQRARLFKRLDTKGEGERNTQAARHHHRQHVGHAGQQVTIRTRRLFFPSVAVLAAPVA